MGNWGRQIKVRREQMQRPVGITVLSILAIISGALAILGGLLGILGYTTQLLSAVSPWSATKLSGGQIIMASVIVLALGALDIVWGIGSLRLRPWAWILGVVLSGLNIIDGVYGFATRGGAGYIVGIVLEAIILAYLFSGNVRQAFGR
jgi:hypothetical protein